MTSRAWRLAVIALLFVTTTTGCGGGGGGGGTGSTSSSRQLPDDPGAAAAISLAGVDTNNNGVRDEVERSISSNTPVDADFASTMRVAAAYQKMITSPAPMSRAAALAFYAAVICAKGAGTVYTGDDGKFLLVQTFDTPDRLAKYQAIGIQLGGGFSADELPECQ